MKAPVDAKRKAPAKKPAAAKPTPPARRWSVVAPAAVPREEPAPRAWSDAQAHAIADAAAAPTELERARAARGLTPDGMFVIDPVHGVGIRAEALDQHDATIHERPTFKATVERFIDEYMLTLNATEAYSKAHPTAQRSTAQTEGAKTLANPAVAAEVARRRKELSERTGVTVEKLVARLWAIARANPNELTSWRVSCCRNCWGVEHRTQRTDAEYQKDRHYYDVHGHMPIRPKLAKEKAADYAAYKLTRAEWDEQGGPGFDRRRPPHPECPECLGEGKGRMVLRDTRELSEEALALFAGVKETKEGIEVKLHDQLAALEKLMRHLGAYEKDNKQKGEGQLAALLASFNKTNALPVVADAPKDGLE